jgi:tripartite-type tricarboxylate transporter receptor subunit TctC
MRHPVPRDAAVDSAREKRKVKALAVSSDKRDPALPNVPTVGETPGWRDSSRARGRAYSRPRKRPPDIVAKVNAEVNRIMRLPDMKEKLASQGTTPLPMSPQEFGKWLIEQQARWAKLIKETGFKLE